MLKSTRSWSRLTPMRPSAACALAIFLAGVPAVTQAQAADPAASQIQDFNDTLLATMKQARQLGAKGRFQKLDPAIAAHFDLPTMTRFAVGSSWSTLSPSEQASLVAAFRRMTVATYAHNFDGYNGQHFVIDSNVVTRGADKLVKSHLVGGAENTDLTYRMRQSGGTWKIIDVYYNSTVSALLGQRSEYASTLRAGGAPALIKKLNSRAEELLRT
jgi:phospholipid transport system substrate-binding protein